VCVCVDCTENLPTDIQPHHTAEGGSAGDYSISVLPHGLRGASQAGNSSDVVAHLVDLHRKKEELEQQERELDEQYQRMQQCLRNISEDTTNDQYPPTQPVLALACGQRIE